MPFVSIFSRFACFKFYYFFQNGNQKLVDLKKGHFFNQTILKIVSCIIMQSDLNYGKGTLYMDGTQFI